MRPLAYRLASFILQFEGKQSKELRSIQNPFLVRLESRFWSLETGVMKTMVSSSAPLCPLVGHSVLHGIVFW